jgi:NADPH:quinone reductase-like Zn-dependent oxidoreductase
MGRVMRAKLLSLFVGQKMTNYLARPNAADLDALKQMIELNEVKPAVGARFSLSDVPTAIGELGSGHGRGKVVITI